MVDGGVGEPATTESRFSGVLAMQNERAAETDPDSAPLRRPEPAPVAVNTLSFWTMVSTNDLTPATAHRKSATQLVGLRNAWQCRV